MENTQTFISIGTNALENMSVKPNNSLLLLNYTEKNDIQLFYNLLLIHEVFQLKS